MTDDQLYPLFHALVRHKTGEKRIARLELGPDLGRCLRELPADRFDAPPAPEDCLSAEQAREIVEHAEGCSECKIRLLEDGAAARRKKTEAERAVEQKKREARDRKLKIKFAISLTYGAGCVVGANLAITKHRLILAETRAKEGKTLKATGSGPQIHPLQILFVVLIFIAAWGLAECWQIATTLWIDFTKAKRAVPIIGKAWAERSQRKKEELLREQRRREQQ